MGNHFGWVSSSYRIGFFFMIWNDILWDWRLTWSGTRGQRDRLVKMLRVLLAVSKGVLYCWVSGMGSFAPHCAGQKGAGMQFGVFSFLSFSCLRLLHDLVSLDLSLDGLEFLRYEIRSENCSFVGVPQLEHDLSLRVLLD